MTTILLYIVVLLLFYVLSFTAEGETGTAYWVMVACVCVLSTPVKDFFFNWSIVNQYAENIDTETSNKSVKRVVFSINVIALLSLLVFMLDKYFMPDLIHIF